MQTKYRLSDKQRLILRAAQLRADISIEQLAHQCGVTRNTARHALDQLLDRKIIWRSAFVNWSRTGRYLYLIHINFKSQNAATVSRVVRYLQSFDNISWINNSIGQFDLSLNARFTNVFEVEAWCEEISLHNQNAIKKVTVLPITGQWVFGSKFLDKGTLKIEPLVSLPAECAAKLDKIDWSILTWLKNEREISASKIARGIKVPVSTVEYHLKKLEKAEIIGGYFYIVEPARFGMSPYALHLSMACVSKKIHQQIVLFCQDHLHVDCLLRTIGSWEYDILLQVADVSEVIQFQESLHEKFGAYVEEIAISQINRVLK